MSTHELLIATGDPATRKQMAELFAEAGYQVSTPASIAGAVQGILKQTVKVVLLGTRFDELLVTDLIPLFKQCRRDLTIILVASELPLAILRKARHEGIFYHALKPVQPGDEEELRQAVKCAFAKANQHHHDSEP